jgi:hypothetical protein
VVIGWVCPGQLCSYAYPAGSLAAFPRCHFSLSQFGRASARCSPRPAPLLAHLALWNSAALICVEPAASARPVRAWRPAPALGGCQGGVRLGASGATGANNVKQL